MWAGIFRAMDLALIGLGGIGASVGLAWRQARQDGTCVGYDVVPDAVQGALHTGAIDRPAACVAECADAELIVVATPPCAVPEVFQQLAPHLRSESVLTDVVSVKRPVLRWAEAYLSGFNRFVGGHPIAGTEHHGVHAARADLFQGALWVLTPTAQTDSEALQRVEAFVRRLHATPFVMDALQHDREFALLSCVPHTLAFSLMAMHRENPTALSGGGSWHSATRVAQSDPTLWAQLLALNREPTRMWLEQLTQRLQLLMEALAGDDLDALQRVLRCDSAGSSSDSANP